MKSRCVSPAPANSARALIAIIVLVAASLACGATAPAGESPPQPTAVRPTPRVIPTIGSAEGTPVIALAPNASRLDEAPFTFIFAQDDQAGAQAVLQAAKAIADRLAADVAVPVGAVQVQLFATRDAYSQALGVTAPADQVGHVVDRAHIWLVTPSKQSDSVRADILKAAQVLIVLIALMQQGSLPMWVRDGIASYEVGLWDARREAYLRSLVGMRRITGLAAFDDSSYDYLGGAVTAHTVIDYLVRTYGKDSLRTLVAATKTAPLSQAIEQATGVSYADFGRGWYAYILKAYGK